MAVLGEEYEVQSLLAFQLNSILYDPRTLYRLKYSYKIVLEAFSSLFCVFVCVCVWGGGGGD